MTELGSVPEFFKGKTILVTGVTGFVGKIFVEKILRIQPNIKKLYLLVRASNPYSAAQRLHYEVFGVDLFKVLREKWGAEFGSFISEKVVAIAGDVSINMFGLKDKNVIEEMLADIDIIVHTAANTKFDDRYDVLMGTNTMGAYNVLNFASKCRQIEVLLHLSTAYVNRKEEGLITEESIQMDPALERHSRLDINLEKHLIGQKLSELGAQNANEQTITSTMKEFGTMRANLHGWPNTYAFTKAMGEMIVENMKDNIPLIIARPTCIMSTHSEPFPGWIEGVRAMDFLFVEYFKGTITSFVGHPETIFDIIPADMVINSMIIALVAHFKNSSKTLIYHVGTSLRNPIKLPDFEDMMYCYVINNPWLNKSTKSGAVIEKFTYCPPKEHEFHQNKEPRLKKIMNYYKPFLLARYVFDDQNAETLRMAMKGVTNMDEGFNFDPKNIDLKDYMMNIHFPGLMKYSMVKYSMQSKM